MDKPYVLIVDDNEATCTLVTALLQRDFQVESAADGNEAVEQIRTRNYAAILLDLRMPHFDGYAVLDFIGEQRPELLKSVLVLTAALSAGEMSRLEKYQICGIVPKPFEVETLLAAVKQCVDPDPARKGRFYASGMMLLLAEMQRLL